MKKKRKRKVIKVAPRPAIIRKRYARFLSGLGKYLARMKEKMESELQKEREREEFSLAE